MKEVHVEYAECANVLVPYLCVSIYVLCLYIILTNMLVRLEYQFYRMDRDSTTNQWRCNHGWWPEANVQQQYRQEPDRLDHQLLTAPITINPEKSLLWNPNPDPSSPSETYA